MMGVGVDFCLSVGAGVFRLLVSFTLGDAVVLGGLLYFNSNLVCGEISVFST